MSLRRSPLNDDRLSLHVPQLAQALPECLGAGRHHGQGDSREESDPWDARWLLRVGGERRGEEGQGEVGDHRNSRHSSPPACTAVRLLQPEGACPSRGTSSRRWSGALSPSSRHRCAGRACRGRGGSGRRGAHPELGRQRHRFEYRRVGRLHRVGPNAPRSRQATGAPRPRLHAPPVRARTWRRARPSASASSRRPAEEIPLPRYVSRSACWPRADRVRLREGLLESVPPPR